MDAHGTGFTAEAAGDAALFISPDFPWGEEMGKPLNRTEGTKPPAPGTFHKEGSRSRNESRNELFKRICTEYYAKLEPFISPMIQVDVAEDLIQDSMVKVLSALQTAFVNAAFALLIALFTSVLYLNIDKTSRPAVHIQPAMERDELDN